MFKSRWKAVAWSLCILLTAYCAVPLADMARTQKAHSLAHAQPKTPWSY